MPVAAVFGSARAVPGDREYEDALALGRGLAEAGWAVMTGGYAGVMEAAARGANEAGGRAIGITVAGWHNTPNRWLTEERPAASLYDRLDTLTRADGLIAAGGGVGTLAEVAVAWNRRQKGDDRHAPLVVVGDAWARVIGMLVEELALSAADRNLVIVTKTADAAVAVVTDARTSAERDRPVPPTPQG